MRKSKVTYIYGLKDPRDELIHYIGKSDKPERRRREHIEDNETNAERVDWIADLLGCNLEPELVILQEVFRSEWQEAEIYWIARGREESWPLTNVMPGGQGGTSGPREPDYSFMRWYIPDVSWHKFCDLSIMEKDAICLEVARALGGIFTAWYDAKQKGEQVASREDMTRQQIRAGLEAGCKAMYAL